MTEGKTIIITNGNDPQAPYIIRLHESLRDPERGNYAGDFRVYSDALSPGVLDILDGFSIPVHLFPAEKVQAWETVIPSDHPLGKVAKFWFLQEAAAQLEQEGYERILYLDPDILAQKPVEPVLNAIEGGRLLVAPQIQPMTTLLLGPVARLLRAVTAGDLPPDALTKWNYEINTGFMGATPQFLMNFTAEYIAFATSDTFRKYARHDDSGQHAWHDQDYLRAYLRVHGHDMLKLTDRHTVIHLCNGAHTEVERVHDTYTLAFKDGSGAPALVHFAGHSDKRFPEFGPYYDLKRITNSTEVKPPQSASAESTQRATGRSRRSLRAVTGLDTTARPGKGAPNRKTPARSAFAWSDNGIERSSRGNLLLQLGEEQFGERPIRVLQTGLYDSTLMKTVLASHLYVRSYSAICSVPDIEEARQRYAKVVRDYETYGQQVYFQSAAEFFETAADPFDLIIHTLRDKEGLSSRELGLAFEKLRPGGVLVIFEYGGYRKHNVTKAVNTFLEEHRSHVRRTGTCPYALKHPESGIVYYTSVLAVERS